MTPKLTELIVKANRVICEIPLSALGQAVGSRGLVPVDVLPLARVIALALEESRVVYGDKADIWSSVLLMCSCLEFLLETAFPNYWRLCS